jgi:hypothetical protein
MHNQAEPFPLMCVPPPPPLRRYQAPKKRKPRARDGHALQAGDLASRGGLSRGGRSTHGGSWSGAGQARAKATSTWSLPRWWVVQRRWRRRSIRTLASPDACGPSARCTPEGLVIRCHHCLSRGRSACSAGPGTVARPPTATRAPTAQASRGGAAPLPAVEATHAHRRGAAAAAAARPRPR